MYTIAFSDTPTKWIARVPLHGMKDIFHENDAKGLEAQALTMQFIKQNTDIPVPEVVHYDVTFENELGAPFIMMTALEGKPSYEVWYDTTCDPATLQRRRENILKSIATAMIKLRFFSASKSGELEFEHAATTTEDISTGKLRVKDIRNLHSVHLSGTSEDIMFSDLGPFSHTQDYFRSLALDSLPNRPFPDFARGQQKLLQIMIDAVPVVENEQFVLAHPDFDVQNFLVSQEGFLTGVLDWDGVAAYPRCLGYARYPSWITRDWDPLAYMYGSEKPGWHKKDPPETLRKFRRLYREIIEEELGEHEAGAMVNSHLYEAIDIAARNPVHSAAIVNLLARRCIPEPLFEVSIAHGSDDDEADFAEGEGGEEDEPVGSDEGCNSSTEADIGDDESHLEASEDEDVGDGTDAALSVDHEDDLHYIPEWVFDLYIALGEERVPEAQIEMLRQKFREVLTITTRIVE